MKKIALVFVIILAFAAGYFARGCAREHGANVSHGPESQKVWTCSMHPQIQRPKPGQCPICEMDLIPLATGGAEEEGERTLVVTEAARALAEIQTSPVERKFVTAEIQMAGKIDYDETRLSHITAWVPGRLDRLYVNYTGVAVKKGDHLVYMYSPDILTAQQELIQALKTLRGLKGNGGSTIRGTAKNMVEAAQEKLRLWGLTADQIAEIEKLDKPSDHIEIRSPMTGVVINKNATEGMYVKTGTRIYTIADLSRVWVKLDAYESDLQWIRYGQKVGFKTESFPDKQFKGMISFIDPVVDSKTRTVKVRVIVGNKDGKLKPGMFIKAVVRPEVAAGGRVMDPALSGKWMCPMHPEVVKDKTGKCDVCGMALVPTEKLGYTVAEKTRAPLVIPVSAPLITGRRAVVYVRVPDRDKPTFEGREIILGPRAGDYYIVKAGLKEGEKVVTKGNFKIDSALQLEAKPSMMNPGGEAPAMQHRGHKMRKPQTLCPVMGGKINKKHFTDYKGKRIYFCCPGCEPEFKKDPDKYMNKFKEAGIELEDTPNA